MAWWLEYRRQSLGRDVFAPDAIDKLDVEAGQRAGQDHGIALVVSLLQGQNQDLLELCPQ